MRPIYAMIDLGALRHNLGIAQRCAPRSRVFAVIKANAYGHGLLRAARAMEVAAEPYVSRESGSGTREFADQYFRRAGIVPEDINIVMELGSPEAIKGVVATGIGVSIVSRATVTKELTLGILKAIPLEPRLIRTLSLVYLKEKFRSRLLSTFIEFAIAKMKVLNPG
jgi:DNA-binding transcriptional LysR family regulator